jgi:hypothetical protein
MRHFARVATLTLLLAACTDIISPPRVERYEYRIFEPEGEGEFFAAAFHWPREMLPVKVWIADDDPLRPALVRAIGLWENAFLYGEFRAELVGDQSAADILVRNEVAPILSGARNRLGAVAPQCRGATDFDPVLADGVLTLPFNVYVWSRIGPDGVDLDTCYEITVIHELGHALGLFTHSTNTGDVMFGDPVFNGLSDRDRATAEAAYHLPATVRPER